MKVAHQVDALIGNTPLIDLSSLLSESAQAAGTRVLGKYEATNPGGSVKDRVARYMLDAAEASGELSAGGTVIEPTSGNTGVGLAMLTAARGYKMILTMPETMSIERRKLAAAYGAEIVLTPGADGMKGAIAKANELHEQTPNSIIAGQFSNPANPLAHYETTGPEIWTATEGSVDVIVAGVGTGGTISGVSKYLKEHKASAYSVAVEPAESPVLSGGKPGAHKIQGIGAGFVPDNFKRDVVDEILPVPTADAIAERATLAAKTGMLVGISSGASAFAALSVAERPEFAGKTIVAVLPDTGERYLSMDL